MFLSIIKRDGRVADYNVEKIATAISKAMDACGRKENGEALRLAKIVETKLLDSYDKKNPTVEEVQDYVEKTLMENGYAFVAKKYILYRAQRSLEREKKTKLMQTFDEITNADADDSDLKRDNANIDANTPMGTMLKYGSEGSKDYYMKNLLTAEQAKAHAAGDIHIHDLDFYALTLTCCQIDIISLFKNGFSTGHGFLREPNDIASYSALACIAIQANQNDQHGGQSVPNLDYGLAMGVVKSYKKLYMQNIYKAIELLKNNEDITVKNVKKAYGELEEKTGLFPRIKEEKAFFAKEAEMLKNTFKLEDKDIKRIKDFTLKNTKIEIEKATHQAMEAFIHNLNTMHSRAGAQVPFSSVNYGTDTSEEGRLVVKSILEATEEGLGMGETPIFPIQIFKVKEGINYNKEDPNYDLFKLAIKVSAKRLFPNFSFIDAPFNLQYYKPNHPETEIAYMGCRTRVMANIHDPSKEITYGRGNLSFTSINLPRAAIESKGSIDTFFQLLEQRMELVTRQLLDRLAIVGKKRVKNFPFLMGQHVWIDSDKLNRNDQVAEVMKHGTLTYGFIGLAEALVSLVGKHHGEDEKARTLGYEIISFMRDFADKKAKEYKLNFSLIATPAEGLSGRFVKIDKKRFGEIKGVTDREYYTNSFHVPVYYSISAFDKIRIEAPYHGLTNGGHIAYVELDGDAAKNTDAFEQVVRFMKEQGIGYGSVNHPVDRDPVCGFNGIIDDECPCCHRKETEGPVGFERIRRITGYLVGTLDRFNNAKKAEEKDRVKHSVKK